MSTRPTTCSAIARAAAVPLAGTASTALGYVCIEHNGPWGPKILKDVEFGPPGSPAAGLATHLAANLPAGITPLLIRRHGSRHGIPARPTVAVVALTPHGGRGIITTIPSLDNAASLDFRALINHARLGSLPSGWRELGPTYLVCTHTKRDQCCAVVGRPVAGTLAALRPENTWEVSHLGGHRMAPNVVTLPDGVHYGQLDAAQCADLVQANEAGELLVANMRGRAALAPAVQAAEIALREREAITHTDGLRLVSVTASALTDSDSPPDHGPLTISSWEETASRARWDITVVTATPADPPVSISCGAEPVTPPPEQLVRSRRRTAPTIHRLG